METPTCSLIPGMDEWRAETQSSEAEKHEKQVLSPSNLEQLFSS